VLVMLDMSTASLLRAASTVSRFSRTYRTFDQRWEENLKRQATHTHATHACTLSWIMRWYALLSPCSFLIDLIVNGVVRVGVVNIF
jgi:hypothetical protein